MLTQGKRKGYIKAETIKSRFDRYNLSDEEFDAVINKFADEDIEVIIEGEEPDDMYSDLDIDIQISASSEDRLDNLVQNICEMILQFNCCSNSGYLNHPPFFFDFRWISFSRSLSFLIFILIAAIVNAFSCSSISKKTDGRICSFRRA